MERTNYDVIIVGAGAAGLATGIFAARRHPELRIAALDGARKLGAKILVSGGGRCNVTNARVVTGDFCGGSRNSIRKVLEAFTTEETVRFFQECGVSLHEEQWGKLFPDSHSARTVLDALLAEARRLEVQLLPSHRVVGVERIDAGRFVVDASVAKSARGVSAQCNFESSVVVLACGGMSLPKTGSDGGGYELARRLGHSIIPPTPALAPLVLEGDFHQPLSGISVEAGVSIRTEDRNTVRIRGPMLWTHFGASGPAIMDASRHWHRAQIEQRNVTLSLSFLPAEDFASLESRLLDLAASQPKAQMKNAMTALLPSRLLESILIRLGIPLNTMIGQLPRSDRRRLVHTLLEWPLPVRDSRGYQFAEATAGGVPLTEINPSTMASRVCPGLFVVGEILDVDGRIGGFNFQWAWSSGFVAAEGIARWCSENMTKNEEF